ncbi:MAG: RnfABCDGE type electron transport complex subunit D [Anaerorhabdus sp.]
MKYIFKPSPSLKSKQSTSSIMKDLTIGLLVVYAFSLFYYFTKFGKDYGIRAIILMVVAVATAFVTEAIWFKVIKQDVIKSLRLSYSWVTAMILCLMVPINTSIYGLIISTIIAIIFGKLVFGGFGNNIFNPAAVGRGILAASFAGNVSADFLTGATPTTTMASSGWISSSQSAFAAMIEPFGGMSNMAIGMYPGSLGETSAIVILLVGIYLAYKKVIDIRVPLVYVGAIFIYTLFIGLAYNQGINYPLFHILSGGVLFGAIFMLTDPVTSPTSGVGKIIFALGCAILTIVLRLKANLPEGVLYSILLMNMLTPSIERFFDGQQFNNQRKYIITLLSVFVFGGICVGLSAISLVPTEATEEVETEVEVEETLELGNPVSLNEDLSRFDAQIESSENGVYVVNVKGYGLIEGDSEYGDYERNKFEIVITDGKVESVKTLVFGDTKGIGDVIDDPAYQELFIGVASSDLDQEIDTVTSATWTTKSMIAAVQAALMAEQ